MAYADFRTRNPISTWCNFIRLALVFVVCNWKYWTLYSFYLEAAMKWGTRKRTTFTITQLIIMSLVCGFIFGAIHYTASARVLSSIDNSTVIGMPTKAAERLAEILGKK